MPKQAPKANLAAIWADAVPLGKFLSERAERGTTKATLPSEAAPPSTPARAVRKSRKVSIPHAFPVRGYRYIRRKKTGYNRLVVRANPDGRPVRKAVVNRQSAMARFGQEWSLVG